MGSTVLGQAAVALLFVTLPLSWFSRICLRGHKKLKGVELEQVYGAPAGLKAAYNLITFGEAVIYVGGVLLLAQRFDKSDLRIAFVTSAMLAVFPLADALFALATGAYPASTRFNWDAFVYDPAGQLRWIAFWQIALALGLIAASAAGSVVVGG